jgi:hypothetical protein
MITWCDNFPSEGNPHFVSENAILNSGGIMFWGQQEILFEKLALLKVKVEGLQAYSTRNSYSY